MSAITVAYYKPSGVICSVAGIDELLIEANKPAGTTALVVTEAPSLTEDYVLNGAVVARPSMGVSVVSGTSVAVDTDFELSGIPVGTTVLYPGGSTVINDGVLTWQSAVPGRFIFILQNEPYKEEEYIAQVT